MERIETVEFTNMCMICDGSRVVVIDRKKRDWPGVGKLRKLEMKDLDAAMLAALKQTNDFVLSQGKPLDPQSAAAYEDILSHQKKEC